MFKIIIYLILRMFVDVYIPSSSMENTLFKGDELIAIKQQYMANDIERGDIVIFKHHDYYYDDIYIKRVIGMPGEHVEVKEGKIYINKSETPLDEEYIKGEWNVDNDGYICDVPSDSYFVLGDNRNDSYDSRYWNQNTEQWNILNENSFVCKKDIIAKAIFVFKPTIRYLYKMYE